MSWRALAACLLACTAVLRAAEPLVVDLSRARAEPWPAYALGWTAPWSDSEGSVVFRNPSPRPFAVAVLSTGCHCLSVAEGRLIVPPGGQAVAALRLASSGWHGSVGGTLRISWSDGSTDGATAELAVTAEVGDLLAVGGDPTGAFRLPDVDPEAGGSERSFVIRRGGLPVPFSQLGIAAPPEAPWSASVAPIDRDEWRVTVSGLERLPSGSTAIELPFWFADDGGRRLPRTVVRRLGFQVLGRAQAIPRELVAGELSVGESYSRDLRFAARRGRAPLAVADWSVDRPGLVGIERIEGGCRVTIHPPSGGERLVRGVCGFSVALPDGSHERVVVPYLVQASVTP